MNMTKLKSGLTELKSKVSEVLDVNKENEENQPNKFDDKVILNNPYLEQMRILIE
jgi:hypothetical protein